MARVFIAKDELISKSSVVYLSPGHAPGMVCTIGPNNNINVATFEQVMVVSYSPPRIIIAISRDCDTYKNIKDGSEATVGFPYPDYAQQAYDGGVKLNRALSELDFIKGLSVYDSGFVAPPSLKQCWVSFECRLFKDLEAGDHNIMLLDIVHLSVDESIIKSDNVETRTSLPALYYTTHGNFFEPGKYTQVKLSDNLKKYENGD